MPTAFLVDLHQHLGINQVHTAAPALSLGTSKPTQAADGMHGCVSLVLQGMPGAYNSPEQPPKPGQPHLPMNTVTAVPGDEP